MKRKAAFKTLGCRLNQFETDALVTDFFGAGYEIVNFTEHADVYIINTCTVTNQSDQRSKYTFNQAVRNANSDSVIVVTGCMAESGKKLFENNTNITYLVDNRRKSSVLQLVDAHFQGKMLHTEDLKQDLFNFSLIEKGFHTRSTIKIQDGCDNFCSYCIVPSVRGFATSRSMEDILVNIKKSIDLGNKEIVLTGVNISRYNFDGTSFEKLIELITKLPGDFRLRISSVEPEGFTDKLIALFEHPKLCHHLHLCLQSGSDKVLKQMQRFYSTGQFVNLVEKFRKRFPSFNFTTDIIVGFPGETEDDFLETCHIIKQVGFSHIHTFKYSKRNGTRAELMSNQVPEKTKNERSQIIRNLSDDNKLMYRRNFIGKEQTVLVEKKSANKPSKGYGENYIPIQIKNAFPERNTFCKVRVTQVIDDKEKSVFGEIYPESV
jgi:threonylcarbamoyladenosine tRNA methylthiotransferase MtaB